METGEVYFFLKNGLENHLKSRLRWTGVGEDKIGLDEFCFIPLHFSNSAYHLEMLVCGEYVPD